MSEVQEVAVTDKFGDDYVVLKGWEIPAGYFQEVVLEGGYSAACNVLAHGANWTGAPAAPILGHHQQTYTNKSLLYIIPLL